MSTRTATRRLLLALGCCAAALAGARSPAAPSAAAPEWGQRAGGPAAAVRGRFVAIGGQLAGTTYACASCHGMQGGGDPSGAFPRIAGQSAAYLYGALGAFASGERMSDVMTPVASALTDAEQRSVALWYAEAQPDTAARDLGLRHSDMLERARSLVTSGRPEDGVLPCAMCHGGEDDPSSADAMYPYLAGQSASYLRFELEQFQAGRRGGQTAAVMAPIAMGLSADEIRALAEYYSSLPPGDAPAGALPPAEPGAGR